MNHEFLICTPNHQLDGFEDYSSAITVDIRVEQLACKIQQISPAPEPNLYYLYATGKVYITLSQVYGQMPGFISHNWNIGCFS